MVLLGKWNPGDIDSSDHDKVIQSDKVFHDYMVLQDWLSHKPYTIDLEWHKLLFSVDTQLLIWGENNHMDIRAINFLPVPKDAPLENPSENMLTKKSIYIEWFQTSWITIADLQYNENISQDIIEKLDEAVKQLNKTIRKNDGINTSLEESYQISPENCYITDVMHGVIFINIKDIAIDIAQMVQKNKQIIDDIVSWKKDYRF